MLSWAAMHAILNGVAESDFLEEFLGQLARQDTGFPYDDISVTCLLKTHHVSINSLRGLYGWKLPGPEGGELSPAYQKAVKSQSPKPLTFHYISVKQMLQIHEAFSYDLPPAGDGRRMLSSDACSPSYDEQLAKYIADVNAHIRV